MQTAMTLIHRLYAAQYVRQCFSLSVALCLGLVLILGLATPAAAHRGHAGLTVVEIDTRAGHVSVVHRFYAHDLEPNVLRILAPDAQTSLDDPVALDALKSHLASRFRLDIDGVRTPLSLASTHLAGDDVRFDFAGQMDRLSEAGTQPTPVGTVRVDVDFFSDVYDDMEMQVNVRVAGVTRTAVFRPGVPAQTIRFQP